MEFTFTPRQFGDPEERASLVEGIVRHTNEEETYILRWLGRVVWGNEVAGEHDQDPLGHDDVLRIDFKHKEERLLAELQWDVSSLEDRERFRILFQETYDDLISYAFAKDGVNRDRSDYVVPAALSFGVKVSSRRMQDGAELLEFWLSENNVLDGRSPMDVATSAIEDERDCVFEAIRQYKKTDPNDQ